jgi:molybdopterin synthase catalytic subunit/molybdopterin synthase sulfur carrier subunit
MMVHIFLFAAAREMVGESNLEMSLDDPCTVADLKRKLLDQYPSMAKLLERSVFAVGQHYVPDDEPLFHGAEIGLIPPVSGG